MNNEKNGLMVRGVVRKVIEKTPYTAKDGTVRTDSEVDLDIDTQRFPFTVVCSRPLAGTMQVGQVVEFFLNYRSLNTKDGKAFSIFRVME